MALFNFGKKKKPVPAPKEEKPAYRKLWTKEFTQSSTFRGYRKIKLSRYWADEVDQTINTLKKAKYDFKGRTIRLENVQSTNQYNKHKVVKVYIDDMLIGSVFSSDEQYYPMLTEYKYDKVHVRIEDSAPNDFFEGVVTAKAYLFVHYPGEAPIKISVTTE